MTEWWHRYWGELGWEGAGPTSTQKARMSDTAKPAGGGRLGSPERQQAGCWRWRVGRGYTAVKEPPA